MSGFLDDHAKKRRRQADAELEREAFRSEERTRFRPALTALEHGLAWLKVQLDAGEATLDHLHLAKDGETVLDMQVAGPWTPVITEEEEPVMVRLKGRYQQDLNGKYGETTSRWLTLEGQGRYDQQFDIHDAIEIAVIWQHEGEHYYDAGVRIEGTADTRTNPVSGEALQLYETIKEISPS